MFKRFAQIHLRVLRYLSVFVHRQLCEGCVCSDKGFVHEARTEAEAGDETVEAVGVEKVGTYGKSRKLCKLLSS